MSHAAVATDRTWDGSPAGDDEAARVSVLVDGAGLLLQIDAPYHGDPPPPGPPGATDGLWNHEVVEVFVLGSGPREPYTEIEVGPHGHHLVLRLEGRRNPVETKLPLELDAVIVPDGKRWAATARLSARHLPPQPHRFNVYAIHGIGAARRYLAWRPPGGDAPDFHRLEVFEPLPPS